MVELQAAHGFLKAEVRRESYRGDTVVVKDYGVYAGTWLAPAARYLMRREARMLQRLRHWQHAPDFAGYRGRYAFAMASIDGQSINQARASGHLLGFSAVLQVLDGLHRQGIVHNDIRGSNLLIDGDGRLILIDYASAVRIPCRRLLAPLFRRLRCLEIASALKFQKKLNGRPLTATQRRLLVKSCWFDAFQRGWKAVVLPLLRRS
ncbi:kinase [Halotalea alkalilenta]|uniref:kinase n=1 Tax=Halotalea alkalilenta TaxID=376489 RepID=UPI00138E0E95|nr:kinase [Halotalea alkalilenta]